MIGLDLNPGMLVESAFGTYAAGLVAKIRPRLEDSAKTATARWISPASRTLFGLTSTPNDGAAVWIEPPLADPGGNSGIPRMTTARPGYAGGAPRGAHDLFAA